MKGSCFMKYPLEYPKFPAFSQLQSRFQEFARLKFEYGADAAEIERTLQSAYSSMDRALERLLSLPQDNALAGREPNGLEDIRKLRPSARRILWKQFDRKKYADRLAGAFFGRMAGCTLGAPVEFWSVEAMRDWAAYIGDPFPPVDYWSSIKNPNGKRYNVSPCYDYTRPGINGVPVDDDITYTILGLLIAEDCGMDFSTEDVGHCWVKYLPYACTAEEVALRNLNDGCTALTAAEKDNPYVQWIGADIRSDPWGYLAPGLPEKAATMAYRDAWISHRRNGIYGEMFFSAVIASAFTVEKPADALKLGLNEIPGDCMLAGDIRWALEYGEGVSSHIDARRAVEQRFGDMSGVHTNLNACLTIFGLMIGGDDFTRCIGETVAMGYDNDCTAATVGSVFGACRGIESIPEHWYKAFHNKVLTYIRGHETLAIDNILGRFTKLAETAFPPVG
jgi:ADP-ribosylglycohydrolase